MTAETEESAARDDDADDAAIRINDKILDFAKEFSLGINHRPAQEFQSQTLTFFGSDKDFVTVLWLPWARRGFVGVFRLGFERARAIEEPPNGGEVLVR